MKNFNFKSKVGFTLIELLVVIGILAVLAAIAIPAVAGLIDRANVSADDTNANEMTNSVERFVSEYELFRQDIASGKFDKNKMDSAQGRVYAVTGVEDRAGIEALEGTGTADGIALNIDTKYPVNEKTVKAVVNNYMKTSASTFTPKQSDCHFYYSADCGTVICTSATASTTDKNAIVNGKDAKGNTLSATTVWIDLTASESASTKTYSMLNATELVSEGTAGYFRSEADYDKFESVKIDGQEISSSNYTTESGSTIVHLGTSYISTLSKGSHTIEIVSNDGSATTNFTVGDKGTFYISDSLYTFTKGMTWANWIYSYGISASDNEIVRIGGTSDTYDKNVYIYNNNQTPDIYLDGIRIVENGGAMPTIQNANDTIVDGATYKTFQMEMESDPDAPQ